MYCNWLLQKITLFKQHQAISELHLTPQSAGQRKALSAQNIHTDMQFAKQLPWAVVWSLSPLWYNSLSSHEGNHGLYGGLSVTGKWNAYFLHMSENGNKQLPLTRKWCRRIDNEFLERCDCICFHTYLNLTMNLNNLSETVILNHKRVKRVPNMHELWCKEGFFKKSVQSRSI